MIGEREGCAILTKVFTKRGYAIERDVALELSGVSFNADGWDAEARVGFEYLTHEAGDYLDLGPDELTALSTMMERGELYILLIDEHEVDGAGDLAWAAERFLDEVAKRRARADDEGAAP